MIEPVERDENVVIIHGKLNGQEIELTVPANLEWAFRLPPGSISIREVPAYLCQKRPTIGPLAAPCCGHDCTACHSGNCCTEG